MQPSLWHRVAAAQAQLDALHRTLTELLTAHASLADRVDIVNARVDLLNARSDAGDAVSRDLGARIDGASSLLDHQVDVNADIVGRLDELTRMVSRIESELIATPYATDRTAIMVTDPDGRSTLGYDRGAGIDDYARFEDVFRGSESAVEARLAPYGTLLANSAPVLDVGCGRGELLSVLRDRGVEARGVDTDESMLLRCASKGLDAHVSDGIEELRAAVPGSLGAVVSIEVIEHLPVERIEDFFTSAHAALRSGGRFVVETVNPHSPMALKAFWVDLTHVRPLYPEALLAVARAAGFSSAYMWFPHAGGSLDESLRTCGEYAIVATK